jgi:hypothetical protein
MLTSQTFVEQVPVSGFGEQVVLVYRTASVTRLCPERRTDAMLFVTTMNIMMVE